MSGLNIFNAHPALYWGKDSHSPRPGCRSAPGTAPAGPVGVTRIAGLEWETTGVLGLSQVDGRLCARGFPSWATVPGPASGWSMARRWHFFFAWVFVINGIAYLLYTLFSRHLTRDLLPTRAELRGIGTSIKDHLLLRHPSGDAAKRYNVLQNLAYLIVIFGLLPLVVMAGLAMSPRLDTVLHRLGRSARRPAIGALAALHRRRGAAAVHAVHLFEVVVAGLWNESPFDGHRLVQRAGRQDRQRGRDEQQAKRPPDAQGPARTPPPAARHRGRRGCRAAQRVRSAVAQRGLRRRAEERRATQPGGAETRRAAAGDGAGVRAPRHRADLSQQRHARAARCRLPGPAGRAVLPTSGWPCAAWSSTRPSTRWRNCAECRRARRSHATIVSRAGAASANGRACRWPRCSASQPLAAARFVVFRCFDSMNGPTPARPTHATTRASTSTMPTTRRRSWPTS